MFAKVALALAMAFAADFPADAAEHGELDEAALFPADEIKWVAGPPSLPKGALIAVLEGDPTTAGPFVFRVKAPDGYRIPLHTHPKTERVTVISGTFHIRMEGEAPKAMPAGTYGHWPAGMKHFVWVEGETVIQFHGEGPWTINYVSPADDPRKTAARRRTMEFTEDTLDVVQANVANEKAVLVDVRSLEEWNEGHIEGSIFVPVTSLLKHSLDSAKLAETVPADKILYTFCVVGMRAKQAAKILEDHGYVVRALQPGYEQLVEAGFGNDDTRERHGR
jgi:rhodanese-related sulfurtransferase